MEDKNNGSAVFENSSGSVNISFGSSFFERAAEMLKKNSVGKVAMISVDIDYFKLFNELFGRKEGDRLLNFTGEQLAHFVSTRNAVAGYFGGDNFAILLPWDESYRKALSDRYIAAFSKEFSEGFYPSFGIYVTDDHSESPADMYEKSQLALAPIRKNYAMHVNIMKNDDYVKEVKEQEFFNQIIKGIKQDEFTFYLQPQCDRSDGKIIGAEALVRWVKPDGNVISPGKFIPFLEKTGYIVFLDKYIWNKVCRWQRSLIDREIQPVPCSVNVSRIDFHFMDVASKFKKYIKKYDLDPQYIEIEITESAYVESANSLNRSIRELHDAGFTLLMDDFGSGYSSLNALRSLDVDVLKTDMKFLGSDGSRKGVGILESVYNMASLIGMPVISEGVENEDQLKEVSDIGGRYIQGYYYYKPMPVKEFEKLLIDQENIKYADKASRREGNFHARKFLSDNIMSDTLFNNILGPAAFLEIKDDNIRILQMNRLYYELLGNEVYDENYRERFEDFMDQTHDNILSTFTDAEKEPVRGSTGITGYRKADGENITLLAKCYYLNEHEGGKIYYVSVNDISGAIRSEA